MRSNVWRVLFALALVGAMGLELLGEKTPPEAVWDNTLFFALMGLLGCLILSFLAKGIVAPALDRAEDFYGSDDAQYDWSTESPAARKPEAGDDPSGFDSEAERAPGPDGQPAADHPERGEG